MLSRSTTVVAAAAAIRLSRRSLVAVLNNNTAATTNRSLSSQQYFPPASNYNYSGKSNNNNNALNASSPKYTVFDQDCLLSLKVMLPKLKVIQSSYNNTVYVDNKKKGRLLLEWMPRSPHDGSVLVNQVVRFGLSAEEVGLILNQLPAGYSVELIRKPQEQEDVPVEKVFKLLPGEGGQVTFQMETTTTTTASSGPAAASVESPTIEDQTTEQPTTNVVSVTCQLGEFQVMMELMRSSISTLVGWDTILQVAVQKQINEISRQQGGGYRQQQQQGGYHHHHRDNNNTNSWYRSGGQEQQGGGGTASGGGGGAAVPF